MNIKLYKAKKLEKIIKRKVLKTNIILDIGCGIRPQNFITPIIHICAEPFEQYIKKLQELSESTIDRSYLIIKSSWEDIIKIMPENSVDTIFLLDVIEHINKNKGKNLLKETEKIARKQIIIFTPLGFLPQVSNNGKDAWGMDGGKWQEHKSGWVPEDFDNSWEIYASKEYHFFDHSGNKYQNPYGAFYAIKTKKFKESLINKIIKKCFLINNFLISKPVLIINNYKKINKILNKMLNAKK
ncbi:class I SAM-dependent methyltransferase [bacterium]|nr:class I SAM-dependent methyltransferase [bacterium]